MSLVVTRIRDVKIEHNDGCFKTTTDARNVAFLSYEDELFFCFKSLYFWQSGTLQFNAIIPISLHVGIQPDVLQLLLSIMLMLVTQQSY